MIEELGGAVSAVLSMLNAAPGAPVASGDRMHRLEGDLGILVGIVGPRRGILSYEFDDEGIRSVLGGMMPGMSVEPGSEMAVSALAELSNMISGNFLTGLGQKGLDITPPTVVRGRGLRGILNTAPSARLTFPLGAGRLTVAVSLV
jgi:CheY-specific phosphatase CheX